jgi:hypothetical protein
MPEGDDLRIFPWHYAPVMVMENGRRVVKPMRYQLRPAGKPAFSDDKFPGTYTARRDSLDGYWRGVFGYPHGVIIADAFYESRARAESDAQRSRSGVRLTWSPSSTNYSNGKSPSMAWTTPLRSILKAFG